MRCTIFTMPYIADGTDWSPHDCARTLKTAILLCELKRHITHILRVLLQVYEFMQRVWPEMRAQCRLIQHVLAAIHYTLPNAFFFIASTTTHLTCVQSMHESRINTLQGESTLRFKKWSSVASRRQCERCDVTYALLPTVAKIRWFMFRCIGSHCNFVTVGNNAYVTSQRSRCLRDATDDHFLSLIVDSPSS